MKKSHRILLWLGIPVTLTLAGLIAGQYFGIRINTTASLPIGLYRLAAPTDGDVYVTACPPLDAPMMKTAIEQRYFPDGQCPGGIAPLVKLVAARAGDTVILERDRIIINGQEWPNTLTIYQDGAGRALTPYPRGTYTVPVGMVWLIANEHPRSFDSRYFGPIAASSITETLRPVLTFKGEAHETPVHR